MATDDRTSSHNREPTGFAVLYRWRLKPGCMQAFQEAWAEMTLAIRERRGGQGSRLHTTEDGLLAAYAQWPSREAWDAARALESAHSEAGARMAAAVEESFEPLLLDVRADLFGGAHGSDAQA